MPRDLPLYDRDPTLRNVEPTSLSGFIDEPRRLGSHMQESYWMMAGSRKLDIFGYLHRVLSLRAAGSSTDLLRRAPHRSVRTKHAAIARPRSQQRLARLTLIEPLARIHWHRLGRCRATVWAGNRRFQLHRPTHLIQGSSSGSIHGCQINAKSTIALARTSQTGGRRPGPTVSHAASVTHVRRRRA